MRLKLFRNLIGRLNKQIKMKLLILQINNQLNNNMKKTNLIKKYTFIFSSFCLFLLIGLATSCQKEDLETNPTEATAEEKIKPIVEPTRYDYKYDYNGKVYNEKQWETKYVELGSPNVSVVVFNDVMYIFDDYNEAQQFENVELQSLMDKEPAIYDSLSKADRIVGEATVKFKIELFDAKDYLRDSQNTGFNITGTKLVRKRQKWWGYGYLEGHEWEMDLPSWIRKKTTSYRVTFLQGGSVANNGTTGQPLYLKLKFHLRAKLLSGGGRASWTKTVYKQSDGNGGSSVSKDPDFSDNTAWAALGLTTWDNQIQSVKVQFR